MFRRRQVVQNEAVADIMRKFSYWKFASSATTNNKELADIARMYGAHVLRLWVEDYQEEVRQKLAQSRFTIGLSMQSSKAPSFEQLTKRTTLISDTLLLSHDTTGKFNELNLKHWSDRDKPLSRDEQIMLDACKSDPWRGPENGQEPTGGGFESLLRQHKYAKDRIKSSRSVEIYGMHCPSLERLGQWILDAKPLLKSGLVWYLPSYSIETRPARDGRVVRNVIHSAKSLDAVDYLIMNGRAVDASGAEPIKSRLVRPVLQVDLPFVEGVNLRDFAKITVGEFAAYAGFRNFLRRNFLEMDDAMNAVESDRELVKLGLQIEDQIREMRVELAKVRRKRAVSVTGAVIGSVGAILVAVYGPALAAAIGAIGAGGGVWSVIHTATENSTRSLRENKWYYVWALSTNINTNVL